MSREEGSRAPNPAPNPAGTSEDKRSTGQVLHDIFEPPKQDRDRMLVLKPRLVETRVSHSEERPASRRPTERDGERMLIRERVGSPKETFDIICSPDHPRDATVRLNFRVFRDLDDELEEFNRTFFNEHLLAHIAYPWVFVQYAEMLFEMGDY
ncbi:hypothetical protein Neosp_012280 [[Neocosmospora] mangrovei]